MKISAAIREYLIEIEVRKYTPKTIRGYRNSLNLFLRFCEQETYIQTHTAFVRRLPYKEQKSVCGGRIAAPRTAHGICGWLIAASLRSAAPCGKGYCGFCRYTRLYHPTGQNTHQRVQTTGTIPFASRIGICAAQKTKGSSALSALHGQSQVGCSTPKS